MRRINKVSMASCLIINNHELESYEEKMVLNVEDILGECMPSKLIIIQEAEIEELIPKLQEKHIDIINNNFSSFRVESVVCLKPRSLKSNVTKAS